MNLINKFLELDYSKYITTRSFKIKVLNEHAEEIEVMEHRYVSTWDKSKPLISPTRIVSTFNPLASFLYKNKSVTDAIDFGKELSYQIEQLVNYKSDVMSKKINVLEIIKNLFNDFKNKQWTPLKAEKHVLYNYFHGFIDLLCYDETTKTLKVIELKTRKTEDDIKRTDVFQCCYYVQIVKKSLEALDVEKAKKINVEGVVYICSRSTAKIKMFEVTEQDYKQANQMINFVEYIKE